MRLLRIALSVRTSNAEAPRNMYISMVIREFHERVHKMALAVYTHNGTSTVALFLTDD